MVYGMTGIDGNSYYYNNGNLAGVCDEGKGQCIDLSAEGEIAATLTEKVVFAQATPREEANAGYFSFAPKNDDPSSNPAPAPFAGFISGSSDIGGCGEEADFDDPKIELGIEEKEEWFRGDQEVTLKWEGYDYDGNLEKNSVEIFYSCSKYCYGGEHYGEYFDENNCFPEEQLIESGLPTQGEYVWKLPEVSGELSIKAKIKDKSGKEGIGRLIGGVKVDSLPPKVGEITAETVVFDKIIADEIRILLEYGVDNCGIPDLRLDSLAYELMASPQNGEEDTWISWEDATVYPSSREILAEGFEVNTEYCFYVIAEDLAGNKSEPSNVACATTLDFAPHDAPYGKEPKIIDDFEDGDLSIDPEIGCGSWSAGPESSCSELQIITEDNNKKLLANKFRGYWFSFSLTTQHHCEVSTAGYNFLEFDIAGKVGHGQVWTSVCGRSLTTALKENGQPVHVQIPLDGCLSFYKLAFWPLITQTCVSENWVTIDNVTLTK